MPIEKIAGVIKDYAWGTPGGIDAVRGLPRSDQIQAEWWLGDHPEGCAVLSRNGESLSGWLARRGWDSLGFLLKVLAPASPLSLQVHPTTAQAQTGFAREESAGLPMGDPTRMYKDPFAKPELLVALGGPFEALAGNAPTSDIEQTLGGLITAGYPRILATSWLEALRIGRAHTVSWLLGGSADARDTVDSLGAVSEADPLLERLWSRYPGDPGVAVALMLNRVVLAAGEALHVSAGQPHAYLSGVGIELMAPSDNVLRGGLTPKHVDVAELLSVASFDPSPPPVLDAIHHSDLWTEYAPPGETFTLHRIDNRESSDRVVVPLRGPALCVGSDDGAAVSDAGEVCVLARGEACVMLASEGVGSVDVLAGSAVWIADRR